MFYIQSMYMYNKYTKLVPCTKIQAMHTNYTPYLHIYTGWRMRVARRTRIGVAKRYMYISVSKNMSIIIMILAIIWIQGFKDFIAEMRDITLDSC